MDITFCTRSRFLDAYEDALRLGRAELDTGGTLRVFFEDGGYPGRVVVTIRPADATSFFSDWEGADETRFPARIKAAVTTLLNCGCVGNYEVAHEKGLLGIGEHKLR